MFKNILDFHKKFSTEGKCERYLIKHRYENGKVVCPYCKSKKACKTKEGRYKCTGNCKRSFTLKIGTIFEGSKIKLQKWFMVIYFVTNSAKGISSVQLSKELSITQKTAWFMLQRVRILTSNNFNLESIEGDIEIDETYIGGSESNKHAGQKANDKTIVLGIVNRRTKQVKSKVIDNVKFETLYKEIVRVVRCASTIITDELNSYKKLKGLYIHKRVNHSKLEYSRDETRNWNREAFKIHTNTVEGFFSMAKRTINGTWHWVSVKHLNKYLSEINYRYNNKANSITGKFSNVIDNLEGRLRYKDLIKN